MPRAAYRSSEGSDCAQAASVPAADSTAHRDDPSVEAPNPVTHPGVANCAVPSCELACAPVFTLRFRTDTYLKTLD